jgi:lysophospholipase L1-like esterase
VTDLEYARRHRQLQRVEGVLDRSALFRALQGLRARALVRLPPERSTVRVPLDQYQRNLEAIVAECRARGIRPVFVALPHRRGPRERPFPDAYPAALVATARRLEVPLVPVGVLGLDSELPDTRPYFIDALHLSPKGNEEMARLLAEGLVRLGLV